MQRQSSSAVSPDARNDYALPFERTSIPCSTAKVSIRKARIHIWYTYRPDAGYIPLATLTDRISIVVALIAFEKVQFAQLTLFPR